jgi:hypothetical protein
MQLVARTHLLCVILLLLFPFYIISLIFANMAHRPPPSASHTRPSVASPARMTATTEVLQRAASPLAFGAGRCSGLAALGASPSPASSGAGLGMRIRTPSYQQLLVACASSQQQAAVSEPACPPSELAGVCWGRLTARCLAHWQRRHVVQRWLALAYFAPQRTFARGLCWPAAASRARTCSVMRRTGCALASS